MLAFPASNDVLVEIFICFTDNFSTLVLRYICVKTPNHRNKKCSLFHIYLFNERQHDFCNFDIGCRNVSTNFVMHRTRLYWIIKRKPKIHVLILGGGSSNFQPCFRSGSVIFVPKGGGGPCVFYQPHFQCSDPPPSLPHRILFDQSLRFLLIVPQTTEQNLETPMSLPTTVTLMLRFHVLVPPSVSLTSNSHLNTPSWPVVTVKIFRVTLLGIQLKLNLEV